MVKKRDQSIDAAGAQPTKTTPSCSSSSKKKFKGVRMRTWGSWVSEIRAPNQKTRIWLGSYTTAEAAARAYDAALLCLRGSAAAASLNFPHHRHDHTISASSAPSPPLSPKSIQRVAAAAAFASPPPSAPVLSSPSSDSSSPTSCLSPSSGLVAGDDDLGWFDFYALESPKYIEPLMDAAFFDPPLMVNNDLLYEDAADIRLWSFC